jgi:hypothetical protein
MVSSITCWSHIWEFQVGDYNISVQKRDREREREFAEGDRNESK